PHAPVAVFRVIKQLLQLLAGQIRALAAVGKALFDAAARLIAFAPEHRSRIGLAAFAADLVLPLAHTAVGAAIGDHVPIHLHASSSRAAASALSITLSMS